MRDLAHFSVSIYNILSVSIKFLLYSQSLGFFVCLRSLRFRYSCLYCRYRFGIDIIVADSKTCFSFDDFHRLLPGKGCVESLCPGVFLRRLPTRCDIAYYHY